MNNRLKVWIIWGVLVVVLITDLIALFVLPLTQRSIVIGLMAFVIGSITLFRGIKQHQAAPSSKRTRDVSSLVEIFSHHRVFAPVLSCRDVSQHRTLLSSWRRRDRDYLGNALCLVDCWLGYLRPRLATDEPNI